jgi:hypothetical protein
MPPPPPSLRDNYANDANANAEVAQWETTREEGHFFLITEPKFKKEKQRKIKKQKSKKGK